MKSIGNRICVLGLSAITMVVSAHVRPAYGGQFAALGDLPGGAVTSFAADVFDDGTIVVG